MGTMQLMRGLGRVVGALVRSRGQLDRDRVTPAERHTLPTYGQFSFLAGVAMMTTDPAIFAANPAYKTILWVLPIDWWALVLIVNGTVLLWAYYLTSWRNAYLCGLLSFTLWMILWGGALAVGSFHGDATWSAPLWSCAFLRFGIASLVSLQVGSLASPPPPKKAPPGRRRRD